MDQEPKPEPKNPSDGLMKGMALFSELTALIISPLILIGGAGYLLAKYEFGGSKTVLLIAVVIAFICSNVLAVYKAEDLVKKRLK